MRGALERSGHNRQVPEERKNASEDRLRRREDRLRRRMECRRSAAFAFDNTDLIVAKDAGRVQGAALNLRVHGSIPWRLTTSTHSQYKAYCYLVE